MDPVLLARIQFALTIGFHFIFPPLTIGVGWIIFYFMNRYRRTGDPAPEESHVEGVEQDLHVRARHA